MRKLITLLVITNTVSTVLIFTSRRFRNWLMPIASCGLVTGPEVAEFYGLAPQAPDRAAVAHMLNAYDRAHGIDEGVHR